MAGGDYIIWNCWIKCYTYNITVRITYSTHLCEINSNTSSEESKNDEKNLSGEQTITVDRCRYVQYKHLSLVSSLRIGPTDLDRKTSENHYRMICSVS